MTQQHVHLGFDARHLAQAQRVDLLRRVIGRRVAAQRLGIRLVAAGQPPQARVVGGQRQLRLQHRLGTGIGGDDGFGGGLLGAGHGLGTVFGRHRAERGDAGVQRGDKHIAGWCVGQKARELAQGRLRDEARHQDTATRRILGTGDAVVDLRGDLIQPSQVVVDIGRVADRM